MQRKKQKLQSKRGRQRPTVMIVCVAFGVTKAQPYLMDKCSPHVCSATAVFIVSESPAVRVQYCSHPPLPSRWLKYKWHYTAGKPSLCSPSLSIALALSFFFFFFFGCDASGLKVCHAARESVGPRGFSLLCLTTQADYLSGRFTLHHASSHTFFFFFFSWYS